MCWYLYIYICILTRNSDSTGSDPPPLSSVRFLRVVRWARLLPSFRVNTWHIVVLLAQVQNRGASPRRRELSPVLLLGFLCCLQSVSCMSSFCSPKKTLGEGNAPRHEQFYKNRFGLGCPALLSFPPAKRSGRCGTLPLDSLVLGFIIFVLLFCLYKFTNGIHETDTWRLPCPQEVKSLRPVSRRFQTISQTQRPQG